MLKNLLLGMSRTPAVKRAVVAFPLTRRLVERFVAGENLDDCLSATHALVEQGLLVTIDFLGEDTTTAAQADRVTDTYVELLNTDSAYYGGSNLGNGGTLPAVAGEWMGRPANLCVTIPPLGAVVLRLG